MHGYAEGIQAQVSRGVVVILHAKVPRVRRSRQDQLTGALTLLESSARLLGGSPRRGGRQVHAAEAAQDVLGPIAERLQDAGQADQGTQADAEAVGLQAVGLIKGEMPTVAMAAVIIGTLVADLAVGG